MLFSSFTWLICIWFKELIPRNNCPTSHCFSQIALHMLFINAFYEATLFYWKKSLHFSHSLTPQTVSIHLLPPGCLGQAAGRDGRCRPKQLLSQCHLYNSLTSAEQPDKLNVNDFFMHESFFTVLFFYCTIALFSAWVYVLID